MDDTYYLHLTDIGREIAEKIYERHYFFREQLIKVGVEPQIAETDACKLEHAISNISFEKLKKQVEGKGRWREEESTHEQTNFIT